MYYLNWENESSWKLYSVWQKGAILQYSFEMYKLQI